jgi:hypothetical protein
MQVSNASSSCATAQTTQKSPSNTECAKPFSSYDEIVSMSKVTHDITTNSCGRVIEESESSCTEDFVVHKDAQNIYKVHRTEASIEEEFACGKDALCRQETIVNFEVEVIPIANSSTSSADGANHSKINISYYRSFGLEIAEQVTSGSYTANQLKTVFDILANIEKLAQSSRQKNQEMLRSAIPTEVSHAVQPDKELVDVAKQKCSENIRTGLQNLLQKVQLDSLFGLSEVGA